MLDQYNQVTVNPELSEVILVQTANWLVILFASDDGKSTPGGVLSEDGGDDKNKTPRERLPNLSAEQINWYMSLRMSRQAEVDGSSTTSTALWQVLPVEAWKPKIKVILRIERVNCCMSYHAQVNYLKFLIKSWFCATTPRIQTPILYERSVKRLSLPRAPVLELLCKWVGKSSQCAFRLVATLAWHGM